MSMNQFLAEFYGTTKTASAEVEQEDLEKQAQYELFAKLASENGIDLNTLSDAQVEELYTATFSKEASEESEEKKEEAKAELEEKKASAEKVAEADFLGRVMAHAYVQEMRKIAYEVGEDEESKEASAAMKVRSVGDKLRSLAHHAGNAAHRAGEAGRSAADKAGKHLEGVGKKVTEKATGVGTGNMKPSHAKGVGAAVYGAGGAAAGGAAAALAGGKKKKASAIDELALEQALVLVDAFNKEASDGTYDLEEAASRLSAVHTLGLGESEKIAAAQDIDTAVHTRALEYLEAAGYPVVWAG